MKNHLVTKYSYGALHRRDFYDLSAGANEGVTLLIHFSVSVRAASCFKADQSLPDHLHDAFSKSQGQDIVSFFRRDVKIPLTVIKS